MANSSKDFDSWRHFEQSVCSLAKNTENGAETPALFGIVSSQIAHFLQQLLGRQSETAAKSNMFPPCHGPCFLMF